MPPVPSYATVARIATEIMQHRTQLTDRERFMLGVKMLMHTDGPLTVAIRLYFGETVVNQVKSSLFYPWIVPAGRQHLMGTSLWTHCPVFNQVNLGHLLDLHEAAAANGYRAVATGQVVYFVARSPPRT
tara:strand:- start:478 stop:864 length:387 start_codon:yes stop_codon:yes gene_type:complete